MSADMTAVTSYQTLVAANSDIRRVIWSQKVLQTVKEKSIFKDFAGGDGQSMPVANKQDLSAGEGEDVVFTSVSPVRGQGVLGEDELRSQLHDIKLSTVKVRVGLMRHAVGWTQVLKKLRLGGTIDQITSDLMGGWYQRKYDDDIQIRLRNYALLVAPGNNLLRVGNRTSDATMLSTDTLSASFIDTMKSGLIAMGATELGLESSKGKAAIPKYMLFAPENITAPLRTSTTYLQGLQYAGLRGEANPMWTGEYPMWNNVVIYPHNIKTDDANGRQGSPLAPVAFLGTAITDGTTTTVTGGGTTDPAGTSDYFANFPGYPWYITKNETLASDSNTYYAMIYNHTTDGKYEIVSYVTGGFHASGKQLTVTRGVPTSGQGNINAHQVVAGSRFSFNHPSGAMIIPCTVNGVPLQWAWGTGADAIFYGTGSEDATPIVQGEDFHVLGKPEDSHLKGFGLQGIRGMSVYTDRRSMAKNYKLIQCAAQIPGVNPVAYTG